ncbi:hypothetical protein PVAND_015942 [Polypedilum vanderplanki]|uniref:Uncharacterized protein n=1 Tax=Polypedilum vanderplanki TaxID=319348 RepID=A0A9J6BDN5_POLVA|nr:hypothetical protein PVAND_015942 [Polypedilum vanderplanki]
MFLNNFLILILIIKFFQISNSVDINCQFHIDEYDTIGQIYSCTVQINLGIKSQNISIDEIHGTHQNDMNNNKVLGFTAKDKNLQYLPVNLSEMFKNLIALRIRLGRLKEIHKSDFEKLLKLKYLNLDLNDIEVLEENLFENNKMLEIIWFEGNQIKSIDSEVFNNLPNLKDLDLSGNICISDRLSNRHEILSFIKKVKNQCFNSDQKIKDLKQNIENFQIENSELKSQNRKLKESLEKLNTEIHELREKNVKNDISALKNEIRIKTQEMLEKSKEFNNRIAKEVQKSSKLQEEIQKMDKKLQQTLNESEYFQEQFKNLTSEKSKLTQEILNLTMSLQSRKQIEIFYQDQLKQLEQENSKIFEELSGVTKDKKKLQTDNHALANKLSLLTQMTSSMSMINETNEDLRDKNAMLVSRVNDSESAYGIILFIFVPIVAFVTLINLVVALKFYRKRNEIKCEHKNENGLLQMKKIDDLY